METTQKEKPATNLIKFGCMSLVCWLLSPFGIQWREKNILWRANIHWMFEPVFVFCLAIGMIAGQQGSLYAQASNQPGAGNCLQFNGLNYVTWGDINVADFGTGNFTIKLWVNTLVNGSWQTLLVKREVCNHSNFWNVLINPTGKVRVELDQDAGATNYNSITGNSVINDGGWHHVTIVRNSNSALIYIDGILDVSNSTLGITNLSNGAPLNIGMSPCNPSGSFERFNGSVDEIQIWNRALTQNEIRNNMCKKLIGNEAGLVGYWRFDETSGNTAFDSSPNGNNGTGF